MTHPTYEEMDRLIENAQIAKQYAWEHYEELAARVPAYILYGPSANFLGAASPCSLTKAPLRKLTKKTRREKYTIYELDADHQVIRVTHVRKDGTVDCTYQVFELGGVIYGRPFDGTDKRTYPSDMEAVKIENGRPVYFTHSNPDCLFCEFYEYPSEGLRRCRQYMYHPHCELTSSYRQIPDRNAPYGAPNSPVSFYCVEDAPQMLDFSKWFSNP